MIIIFTLMCVTSVNVAAARQVEFACSFDDGIPVDFATYDRDGNEPSRSMKKYGFESGVAWVGYTENPDTESANGVAYSGSWYAEAAVSDDWLVTPAIKVESEYTILSWRAYALDAEHPDGYSVYLSTTGNTPADFTSEALYSTEGEAAEWNEHSLSLGEWSGQTVYIAFVNNSENCNILALDDINVFTYDHTFTLTNLTPEAVSSPGIVRVSGEVASSGFMPVAGFKAELLYEGSVYVSDYSDVIIEPGESVAFEFEVGIDVALDTTEDYILTISALDGSDVLVVNGSVTCFERMVLIEEGTGTWCQYCPSGQYALELLHEKYPNAFVDVAVHMKDQLSVNDYSNAMTKFFARGIPWCTMNRSTSVCGDPYDDGETLLKSAMTMGSIGKIACKASLKNDNMLTADVTAEFGKVIEDGEYALSFLVVEDDMTGYAQSNFYSGSNMDMGGLEDLPDPIPAGEYFFANVCRMIYPSFEGDTEAFPAGTERHTPITLTRTFELPELQNTDNLKVVALITKTSTGEVVNVCETVPSVSDAVDEVISGPIKIGVSGSVVIVSAAEELRMVEVWSLDGVLLKRVIPGSPECVVSLEGTGPVIVKTVTASATIVTKQVLR